MSLASQAHPCRNGLRKCEHPLAHGHGGQHSIDEPSRCLRHSTATTGRAEPTTFARERDESIMSAGIAMDTQKSMGDDPALEIRADLSLDEPGNGRALPSRLSQKRLELLADDLVKKGLFGLVAFAFDGGNQSTGTMRARVLPATANGVPRSPSRDDSDATNQPRARVRPISVASNDFYIEPTGSRARRNCADSSLTPTDERTGRIHKNTHERPVHSLP